MNNEKPFLLIIEISNGFTTHATYETFKEASKARDEATKNQNEAICIYNLTSRKVKWENKKIPRYGESIAKHIIQTHLKQ